MIEDRYYSLLYCTSNDTDLLETYFVSLRNHLCVVCLVKLNIYHFVKFPSYDFHTFIRSLSNIQYALTYNTCTNV